MSVIGAIGEMVGGATLARAVEPRTGAASADGHTQERNCLNCGQTLTGDYCHDCGQRAHVHRTLGAFFHDLAHGVFHFEGKTWNTLPLLAWRPGDLTRRYIAGERAKFVSPMALFLFSVFLMFAILGATASLNAPDTDKVASGVARAVAADQEKLDRLIEKRAEAAKAGESVADLDARIASEKEDIALERTMRDKGIVSGSAARVSNDVPAWLRGPIEKAGKNPELLFFKLKANAYKWSWALIPLSVPFMWLLFPFSRRFRLYDHTEFVTYSLSFMTLLVCIGALATMAGAPGVLAVAMLYVPFHMYRQLRGAYGLGRLSAILRAAALSIFAVLALSLFGVAMVALGVID